MCAEPGARSQPRSIPTCPSTLPNGARVTIPAIPFTTHISARPILCKIKASQGLLQGMSYWTYTDLFEEPGPPPTPFHGGFGLLNREGIPKPAYFAYKYLHAVQGNEIPLQDSQAFAAVDHDRVATLIWDFQQPEQKVSNRPFYSRIVPAFPSRSLHVSFSNLKSGSYRLEVHRTGRSE